MSTTLHPCTSHSAELGHVEAVKLQAAGKTDMKSRAKPEEKKLSQAAPSSAGPVWSCRASFQYLLVIQFTASVLYHFRFLELHLDMNLVPTSF